MKEFFEVMGAMMPVFVVLGIMASVAALAASTTDVMEPKEFRKD